MVFRPIVADLQKCAISHRSERVEQKSLSYKSICYSCCSPVICLSGNGGIDMHVNFSTKRPNNQSKCLYRLLTTIPVFWKQGHQLLTFNNIFVIWLHIHSQWNHNLHFITYTWCYIVSNKALHSFKFTLLLRSIYFTSEWTLTLVPRNSISIFLQKRKKTKQNLAQVTFYLDIHYVLLPWQCEVCIQSVLIVWSRSNKHTCTSPVAQKTKVYPNVCKLLATWVSGCPMDAHSSEKINTDLCI